MANSPYSARPGALNQPVPNDELKAAADKFFGSAGAAAPDGDAMKAAADAFFGGASGAAQAPAAPPQPNSYAVTGADANKVASFLGTDEEPAPSFAQANLTPSGIANQIQNFTTRLQTSLAANETEKAAFLKKKFGDGNVKVNADGEVMFRRKDYGKFQRLDPNTVEVINDLIPDLARDAVYEGAQLVPETVGALGGFAAGFGAGAPVTVPAGVYAGRVVGSSFANKVADKVAEFAGIPQDPNRNHFMENAISTGLEAALPIVGAQVAKRLPGTLARDAARAAGEKEVVALDRHSQAVAQAADDLAHEGRVAQINGELVGVPGANVSLMGHQINPDNPDLLRRVGLAEEMPRFRNAQKQLAADWGTSLSDTLQEIARRGGDGPVAPDKLASTVTNAVQGLKDAEGQAISKMRGKAMAELGNARVPLPEQTETQLFDLMGQLGFTRKTENIQVLKKASFQGGPEHYINQERIKFLPPRDMGALAGKFGLTSEGEMRAFVNVIDDVQSASRNGGMRPSDLERMRNVVGDLSDSLYGTPAGAQMGKLASDLRGHYRDVIAAGLKDETERTAFNTTMDEFSSIARNVGQLKRVLKEDSGAKAIVSGIFTGKENIPNIQAIKSLTKNDPAVWAALKEEFINQNLIAKFGDRNSPTGFKSGAFLDSLDKQYGPEFMRLVLDDGPGPNSQTVRKLLTVTERLEKTYRDAKAETMSEQQKQGFMNVVIGLLGDIKFKAVNGFQSLLGSTQSADKVLHDIMTRDGMDRFLPNYPGRIDKKSVAQNLKDWLGQYRVMQSLKPVVRTVKKIPAAAEKDAKLQRGMRRRAINAPTGWIEPATMPTEQQDGEEQ